MKFLAAVVVLSIGFTACKNEKKKKDAPRVVETDDANKGTPPEPAQDSKNYPSTDGMTKADPKPADPKPADPTPTPAPPAPAPAFPYVIEMPKEQYPRVEPFIGEDNSCPGLGKFTQTGNILQIPLNIGGSIAPGTAVPAGSVTAYQSCSFWGRIKGIPAGYAVKASFPATTAMKAKANMRAGSDRGTFPFNFEIAGKDPANLKSDAQFYGAEITPRRFNNTPFNDIVNTTVSYSPEDLMLMEAPVGVQTCPKIVHDVLFSIFMFNTGVRASTTAAALPADGFTHSFYITQFPDIAFTVEKCN